MNATMDPSARRLPENLLVGTRGSPLEAVLITRPEPGASETAARVAAMGLRPVVAPLLEIRPTRISLPPPAKIAAVLLASGSAIDPLPRTYSRIPILTVGDATAARARQAGFTNVLSAGGDAPALAALVRDRLDPLGGTLLLAAGQRQSLALAAKLRASGFRVARRVVYAAEPAGQLPAAAKAALLDANVRTVLFFSAETARCFMRLVREADLIDSLHNREALTIGTAAAVALEAPHWARVRVAGRPTQDEMLALLR
jgi:uroporphyrinogen-III synthase